MSVVKSTILSAGKPMDPNFELLSIDIVKEVNRIPYAQLVLLDGDAAKQKFSISNDTFFEPGKEFEIKLGYELAPQSDATVFKGVLVGHRVEADENGSLLTVDIKDIAVRLAVTRKSAIFRNQTDDKAIAKIIGDSGLTKGSIAATSTRHDELVQYYATDWDFILTRAEANGLLVAVDDGAVSLNKVSISGQPKQSYEYGRSEIFSFEMEATVTHQHQAVETVAWDAKNHKLTKRVKGKEFNAAPGNLKGQDLARVARFGTSVLTNPIPLAQKELQAWSDSAVIRSRLAMIRGRIAGPGSADIKPMDLIEIAGIGDRFNGKTLVTGVRHRVDQNGWQTDVQFGLHGDRFADRRDIIDIPAAGLIPGVNGLQIGLVAAFEDDPDKEFRVKVILPGIDEKNGTVWARLASPDAGKERGYFFRPELGDEVVVGFFNDDPRQAVILGAMYSSKNAPPPAMGSPSEGNPGKGIVTKTGSSIRFVDGSKSSIVIETPESNKIVLDGDAQTIEVSDQHGNMITLSKDGIEIKSVKDVIIDASGNVVIKGQKVDVK